MRVKFVQSIAGSSWCYQPGEVHEIPDATAALYLRSGVAVLADPEPEEAAALAQDGSTMRPRPRRHRE